MKTVEFKLWSELEGHQREELNTLYTNILFSAEKIKTIGIASSNENEGKTFIAMEILRTAANNGKRTILVDCDLRKSRIEQRYGSTLKKGDYKGLTHYLCGESELTEIVLSTNVENADVILAGQYSINPTKLLSSDTFKELMDILKEQYDFIIVDMPPIHVVIDGAIVAQQCDGIVLVVQSSVTGYQSVKKSKEQLERAKCNILGVVLNKVPVDTKQYYYSGRYYSGKTENDTEK